MRLTASSREQRKPCRESMLDRARNGFQPRTIHVTAISTDDFVITIAGGGMRSRGGLRAGHITTADTVETGLTFALRSGDTTLMGITAACTIRVAIKGAGKIGSVADIA